MGAVGHMRGLWLIILLWLGGGQTAAQELEQAAQHLARDELQEARALLEPLENSKSRNRLLALVLARLQQDPAARPRLERALNEHPADAHLAEAYVALLLRQGQLKRARDWLADYLAHYPATPRLLADHARLLFADGRFDESLVMAQEALDQANAQQRSALMLQLMPVYEAAGAQPHLRMEVETLLLADGHLFERPLLQQWLDQTPEDRQAEAGYALVGLRHEYDDYLPRVDDQQAQTIAADWRSRLQLGMGGQTLGLWQWDTQLQLTRHQHVREYDQRLWTLSARRYMQLGQQRVWIPINYRWLALDDQAYLREITLRPYWRAYERRLRRFDLALEFGYHWFAESDTVAEDRRSGSSLLLRGRWMNRFGRQRGGYWWGLHGGVHRRLGDNWDHTETGISTGVDYALSRYWRLQGSLGYWRRDYDHLYVPGLIERYSRGEQLWLRARYQWERRWSLALNGRLIQSRGALPEEHYRRRILGVMLTRRF